jgi:hypothetical protein
MIVALIIVSVLLVVVSFLFIKILKKVYFLNRDNEQLHQQSCEDRRLIDKYKQNCKDLEKDNRELQAKNNEPEKKSDEEILTKQLNIIPTYLKPQGIETAIGIEKRLYEDKEYRDMIDKTACENLGRIIYENHLYEICEDYDIRLEEFNLRYRTWICVK